MQQIVPFPEMSACQLQDLSNRFWVKVERGDGCWEWQGMQNATGYGLMNYGGRNWFAHRLAYFLANNACPGGLFVCHACDNRLCCNPAHLWLGTNADNMADRVAKGRKGNHPRGANQLTARLNDDLVRSIRREHADGISPERLARKYGVSYRTVYKVVKRINWTHVE